MILSWPILDVPETLSMQGSKKAHPPLKHTVASRVPAWIVQPGEPISLVGGRN
jgi:hypothetical protein